VLWLSYAVIMLAAIAWSESLSPMQILEQKVDRTSSDLMIELIAADLDGTLMGQSRRFSPRLQAALEEVRSQGVRFTVATGRIFAEALPYLRQLPITAPVVCSQGGYIRCLDAPRPLHEAVMDLELAQEVIHLSRGSGWHLHIYLDDVAYTEQPIGAEELYRQLYGMQVRYVPDILGYLDRPPAKFLIMTSVPDEATRLDEALRAQFAGRLLVVRSHPVFVEGNPLGASKAQGLAWLSSHLSISRQAIMAIGDQDNDADMVAWAGLGIAMGNATSAVKSAARYVAPSVEEDGVAESIERFVLSVTH
jgi:Cof subfamily protein (haloacid dehalogenase superfamily)